MRYVIVQSVVDFTYNTDANYGQDYTRYTLKNGKAFFALPLLAFRAFRGKQRDGQPEKLSGGLQKIWNAGDPRPGVG